MKPGKTYAQDFVWFHAPSRIVPVVFCLGLLTACVAPPVYDTGATGTESVENNSSAAYPSPSPAASESATTQFNFPLATCGDSAAEPSETWYSVFVDGGSVDEIRNRYCGDAISANRKSGAATVQVASFTSYARALSLAKAIGGVVEQTAQAAPDSTTARSAPATPQPAPAPAPQPLPSGAASVAVGQSAYLNASQAGVPINIREQASTDAPIQATGYPGDPVQIASRTQGSDGYPWYEVRSQAGQTGWVRGDLIAAQPPALQSQPQDPAPDQSAGSADQAPAQTAQPPYPQPTDPQPYDSPDYNPPSYGQSPYNPPPATAQAPGYPGPSGAGQPYPGYPQPAQPPYGTPPVGGRATLTAQDPGAEINIREFASLKSRVRYWANAGDPIQISGSARGDDGQIWYQVQFPSGAMGWVRSDLVTTN